MSNAPEKKVFYAATKKILTFLCEILPTADPNQPIDDNIVGVDDTERLEIQKDSYEQSFQSFKGFKDPSYFDSDIIPLDNSGIPNVERITPHKMINYNLSDDNPENIKLVDHESIHNTESLLKLERGDEGNEEYNLGYTDNRGSNQLFEYRCTNNTIFNPNSEDSQDQEHGFIVSNEFSSIHEEIKPNFHLSDTPIDRKESENNQKVLNLPRENEMFNMSKVSESIIQHVRYFLTKDKTIVKDDI
jgi:hypothetical protein